MNMAMAEDAVNNVEVVNDKKDKKVKKIKESKASKNPKPAKRRKSFSLEKRRSLSGYVFVAPWIIGFLVFVLFPLGMSLYMSFCDVNVVSGGFQFYPAGFKHYTNVLQTDPDFLPYLMQTIIRTFLYTPFIVVLSLFIAMLLNRKIKFRGLFRVIYFLPVLLGTGYVFETLSAVTEMIAVPESITNSLSYAFGVPAIATFLSDLLTQILGVFWKTGVQIVIFLAGLQGIPDNLYEAAKVDNANAWDMLWKVTLPILSPIILLNTIYTIIDSFRDTTNPVVGYIIDNVFTQNRFGIGSAMGWMFFGVAFLIIGIAFALVGRFVYYEK